MNATFRIEERSAQPALTKRMRVPASDLPAFFAETYGSIMQRLGELGQHPAGPPFAMYHNMDMEDLDVEAGFPLSKAPEDHGELKSSQLPGGRFYTATHVGPYDQLPRTWSALSKHVEAQGLETDSYAFEIYTNDPMSVAPRRSRPKSAYL
ncbi:MAG: GyrI-like domain-containing protein [Thermomicrobiales bacterium]